MVHLNFDGVELLLLHLLFIGLVVVLLWARKRRDEHEWCRPPKQKQEDE